MLIDIVFRGELEIVKAAIEHIVLFRKWTLKKARLLSNIRNWIVCNAMNRVIVVPALKGAL